MSIPSAKAALVPLVLAATWATAQADNFIVSVTPTTDLSHLYLFTEKETGAATSYSTSEQAVTSELGPLLAGSTYNTMISTSYGTSVPITGTGVQTDFAFLGTTSTGLLALTTTDSNNTSYSTKFGATGVSLSNALAGATSGDLATASSLYPASSSNSVKGTSDLWSSFSGSLKAYDSLGNEMSIGTVNVTYTTQPVPEPASMAALGVGALALIRRRRKLA